MRRSADALKAPTYVEDKDSGELRRPHHIDLKSGMYRGRQVLKPKSKNVDVNTISDKLVTDATAKLNDAVKNGHLSKDAAANAFCSKLLKIVSGRLPISLRI